MSRLANPRCGETPAPPEALCGGISKVNFQETLSSFGDKCPQNGSKNEHGMPPRRAFCGVAGGSLRERGEGQREIARERARERVCVCVCVCVCLRERESVCVRERRGERERIPRRG